MTFCRKWRQKSAKWAVHKCISRFALFMFISRENGLFAVGGQLVMREATHNVKNRTKYFTLHTYSFSRHACVMMTCFVWSAYDPELA